MKKRIGLRTIKTAIAVFLALLIKLILVLAVDIPAKHFGSDITWSKIIYTPFFGAIAAAYSMNTNRDGTLKQAKIRTMGSLVGGLYGMVILIICEAIFINGAGLKTDGALYYLLDYILVAVAIIPMIHITVMTKKTYATWIACLTYLSVTVSIRNDFDDQLAGVFFDNDALNGYVLAVIFAFNRILSTMIGVGLSIAVNMIRKPRKCKNKDILFCVGIEGVAKGDKDQIVGYMNYELNHMVDSGANCTLFTTRVPRTFMHMFGNLKINAPVVCMSGAALYDSKNLTFLAVETIPYHASKIIDDKLRQLDITPFKNYVFDDVLNVYCEKLDNLGEKLMAKRMKNEGYGNFFMGKCPYDTEVLFYLMIEEREKYERVKEAIETSELKNHVVLQVYDIFDQDSKVVPELVYVKIYSKKIENLQILKDYAEKNHMRICGLTTSDMSNNLLDNSEIKVTTCKSYEGAKHIENYNDMFREIKHIYYGKEYKK